MKKFGVILIIVTAIIHFSFTVNNDLRKTYSSPSTRWPEPLIDNHIKWNELGLLPPGPLENKKDSLKHVIELGKMLFFDPRLSGSGKISCATCHKPELSWTDGREKSIGHEGAFTKRNSPTIQNTWFYDKLFWDGRARDLADQAFAPLNSESEMHNEMPALMRSVSLLKEYRQLFKNAFGDDDVSPDRLTYAIAVFEKTIVSRRSRFDEFLAGNKKALSNSELRGLHLFRTKARCMNCHNGPMFSDNSFHNNGFSGTDKGYYMVTHRDEDMGKMKTPSLRDVMKTGPWMHDGSMKSMEDIIDKYDQGQMPVGSDPVLKPLGLSKKEKRDLLAFLEAISAAPLEFRSPTLPR